MNNATQTKVELSELVRRAETIVDECFGPGGRDSSESKGRTQLSNAIDAINQSRGSVEVFLNWLRYQMARDEFWRARSKTGKMLGELIYKYVEDLQRRDPENVARNLTYFLGFMRRAFIAVSYLEQIPAQLREANSV